MVNKEAEQNEMKGSLNRESEILILLIDDDNTASFINNRYIEKVLGKSIKSYSFQLATEALAFLDAHAELQNEFEIVVFLDLHMPVMDGFGFLEALRLKKYSNIRLKVLMLTSSVAPMDRIRASEYGVYKYLEKPLTEPILRGLLNDLNIMVK